MRDGITCTCAFPEQCAMNNGGFCVLNACWCAQIKKATEEGRNE